LILRLALLVALLVVLGAVAVPRLLKELHEGASFEEAEFFRSNPEGLAKLRTASLAVPTAASEDWPQFRGPERDGISRLKLGNVSWPEEGPSKIWSVPGGEGHSGIAVSRGRVFTMVQEGADEVVLCLEAATGRRLWTQRRAARFAESYGGAGPHATPSVSGDRVFVVGAKGQFFALKAENGEILWSHDLLKEFDVPLPQYGISASPLVDAGQVIVMPGSPKGASVASFDAGDGRLLWKSGTDPGGHSSPILATLKDRRQIVAVTGSSVLGLAPESGALLWRHPWEKAGDQNVATPIVAGDYVFVACGFGKGCALLEISRNPSGDFGLRPVYEHNRMRNEFSTCVLDRDFLYGFDQEFLVCMEFRSGAIRWKRRDFGKGSLLLADGLLIVLGETGKLALVEARPEECRVRSSCTISKTRCWAIPSLAGGRLFVRDQESVSCFDLGGSR
jgi:outer membrane protein assembly factor BamB